MSTSPAPLHPWYSNDILVGSQESAPQTESHALHPAPDPFKLLSVGKVAEMLGVATVTVYRIVARRELPVYRIARKIAFKESDVIAWVEKCKTEARFYK
jgi:excisionase family DNA binding protein